MLILTLALMGNHAGQAFAQTSSGDVDQIVADLSLLEPYVQYVKIKDLQMQVLDTEGALASGFSKEIVLLASEMVAYQNDLVTAASKKAEPPELEKYSRLNQFFDLATLNSTSNKNSLSDSPAAVAAIPPCGDWTYPVPNYTPSWTDYTSSNPESTLISLGFHHTAPYACGYGNCSTADFTRGRSYTGPYGTCASPRFRDHGRITGSTAFRIQYGEPNPEILSYSWPYWNWGSYVQWWHNTY